jgi:pimeloyl-ACP methyl ester carboxylesterase
MSSFVFVHGAWHGGWSWRLVADRLAERGHEVHTPSLTGLGDRAHLGGPHVALETHLQDIVSLIQSHDLQQVVLVGHSYGGIIVRATADRLFERVSELIYVDALVPEDGESAATLVGEQIASDWQSRPRAANGTIPHSDVSRWGIVDRRQHAWVTARVCGHPLRTLFETVSLSDHRAAALPTTYVHCSGVDGERRPSVYAQRVASYANARWVDLRAAHDVMLTHPDHIVELLVRSVKP